MGKDFKYVLLVCLILTAAHLIDGKRSLSGRSRSSSSGSRSSSTRRTQSQTHYSPPPSNNKPSTVHHAPNADHVKLTYGGVNSQPSASQSKPIGWNVPQHNSPSINKPPSNVGPPPAYSPYGVPGAKTNIHEPPPAYKPNNAPPPAYPGTHNQQPASYPKQTYNTASQSGGGYPHNTGTATGPRPVGHNTGYRPHNGTGGFGGVNSPIYAHTVRPVASGIHNSQQGPIQPGFYPHQTSGFPAGRPPMPPGGFPPGVQPVGGGFVPSSGGFAYPQQSAPVFAGSGVQPGFYPAGSFPKSSSGPGFGSGLLAGALGGAILGHALTPTHTQHVVSGSHPVSSDNQDRIIVINNNPGQPATVTNAAGQPVSGVNVIQNGQPAPMTPGAPVAPGVPVAPGGPETPVPLAPFPSQQNAQPNQPAQQGSANVPLAPFPNTNPSGQPDQTNPNATQPQYGTYCVPILVNVTDPNNTANVTQVEQVYCYQVMYPPPEQQTDPAQQNSNSGMPQQQQTNTMSGNYNQPSNDITNYPTQKTSTASLASSSNIKSGVDGMMHGTKTVIDTVLMTMIAFAFSYLMH